MPGLGRSVTITYERSKIRHKVYESQWHRSKGSFFYTHCGTFLRRDLTTQRKLTVGARDCKKCFRG
jgi:hypothetical protein